MADILKVTTPLQQQQSNNPTNNIKPASDIDAKTHPELNIQNTAKVIGTNKDSEILQQNNKIVEGDGKPNILQHLLKDPSVTAAYVKNIFLLEEIIKLLPQNNNALTDEIAEKFNGLLVQPEDVASEMKRQEFGSTSFRGPLFDFLRVLSRNNLPDSDVQSAIANLLRAINYVSSNHDIRDAVANSLRFLAESMNSSKTLAPALNELADEMEQPNADRNFINLKAKALNLLGQVRDSVLFSPKLEKIVSITIYNLSRHNNNQTYLQESSHLLWRLLDTDSRAEFAKKINDYIDYLETGVESKDMQKASNGARLSQNAHGQLELANDNRRASDVAKELEEANRLSADPNAEISASDGVKQQFISDENDLIMMHMKSDTAKQVDVEVEPKAMFDALKKLGINSENVKEITGDTLVNLYMTELKMSPDKLASIDLDLIKQMTDEFVRAMEFIEEQQKAKEEEQEQQQQQQQNNQSSNSEKKDSQVMHSLVSLLEAETKGKDEIGLNEQMRLEKILHSLLSSPCNFTPLLHFVIPLVLDDMRAFSEIWINPQNDDRGKNSGVGEENRSMHMLLVIDVEAVGRFETEVFVDGYTLDVALFCPRGAENYFDKFNDAIKSAVKRSETYKLNDLRVETLARPRSLMTVFKTLPYRRTGVDVVI